MTMRRRLHSSYVVEHRFSTVYMDYDDTVIVDGKVNAGMMQFLYECRNQGKRLILLSRHPGDLAAHMQKFCIPAELFDQIVHLKNSEKKSGFATDKDAIFIDNLYTEREDVLRQTGMPVFDVDAVQGLLFREPA
jgi:hypothetical protein